MRHLPARRSPVSPGKSTVADFEEVPTNRRGAVQALFAGLPAVLQPLFSPHATAKPRVLGGQSKLWSPGFGPSTGFDVEKAARHGGLLTAQLGISLESKHGEDKQVQQLHNVGETLDS